MIEETSYQAELRAAIEAVTASAALCREVQQAIGRGVLEKADRSPVTVADFGSQAIVCRTLAAHFPDDPVVGEEDGDVLRETGNEAIKSRVVEYVSSHVSGASEAEVLSWIDRGGDKAHGSRFWTLDPIDGTKGFLRNEQYAIALALIEDGEVQVAALCCPNLPVEEGDDRAGLVFAAVRGAGVEAHELDNKQTVAVSVSALADSSEARFCESVESGHSSHDDAAEVASGLGITQPSVRLDSQAKYAVVARGDADIYMRLPTRPGYVERIWDHAAGMLVIVEAGGKVTDIDGKPLDFTRGRGLENNRGVIATNGVLHDSVLRELRRIGVAAPVNG